MTDRGPGSSAALTAGSPLTRFACEQPFLFATGALLLGGALVAVAYKLLASGDEPPIRVKKGSMEFHVLHKRNFWIRTGEKWRIGGGPLGTDGGTRSKDTYDVLITPNGSKVSKCRAGTRAEGQEVKFTYSDNTSVSLSAKGRHTLVTADKVLTRSSNKKVLTYAPEGGGHLEEIWVDGTSVCQFENEDELIDVLLMDF